VIRHIIDWIYFNTRFTNIAIIIGFESRGFLMKKRYNSINWLLKDRFGEKVNKVSLDIRATCPVRDGSKGKNGCIYCNSESLIPLTSKEVSIPEIERQLSEGIEYIKKRHGTDKVIAYFQSGSNTYFPSKTLRPLLENVITKKNVVGLAISTRPDCIEDEHIEMLRGIAEKTFFWTELGLQSSHDKTLKIIERGHDVECFTKNHWALKEAGIKSLRSYNSRSTERNPRGYAKNRRLSKRYRDLGSQDTQSTRTQEYKLEEYYNEGKVKIPTLEEYANWVVMFLERLDPKIVIHRLNGHSPRHLTIAPTWSVNKLGTFNEIERQLKDRDTYQGKLFQA